LRPRPPSETGEDMKDRTAKLLFRWGGKGRIAVQKGAGAEH